MGRHSLIDNDMLMEKLNMVFRDNGFSGTSLTELAKATGLKKASLYHRFPDGKNQMAMEVLVNARDRMVNDVLSTLRESGSPRSKVNRMASQLNSFYSGGEQGCFLNVLSSNLIQEKNLADEVKSILSIFINEIEIFLREAGFSRNIAKKRAQRVVMMLQGSLVLCRGTQSTLPFREFIKSLPTELLK